MKDGRNILGWFGLKQEAIVMEDAHKHVDETYKTVTYFAEAVKAFISGDTGAKDSAIASVRESEQRADTLKSKMVDELSKGLLMPPDREDLMHFANTLDKIADWTNGSARLLGFIEKKLPNSILDNMAKATDLIVNSIAKLKSGIEALSNNDLKKALSECEEVHRFEHDADDQKKSLIETIIKAKLEPADLLLSYQLAEYMEGVTDKIEDAADFVKVIAIKSK